MPCSDSTRNSRVSLGSDAASRSLICTTRCCVLRGMDRPGASSSCRRAEKLKVVLSERSRLYAATRRPLVEDARFSSAMFSSVPGTSEGRKVRCSAGATRRLSDCRFLSVARSCWMICSLGMADRSEMAFCPPASNLMTNSTSSSITMSTILSSGYRSISTVGCPNTMYCFTDMRCSRSLEMRTTVSFLLYCVYLATLVYVAFTVRSTASVEAGSPQSGSAMYSNMRVALLRKTNFLHVRDEMSLVSRLAYFLNQWLGLMMYTACSCSAA
mmetsp:Transcript_6276/g.15908  ORF Transcript_6276/g.15908 Transcript_6276/m.15908 type:complete len:270 (-) Transcript_6276:917-1726(-)